jgi:hypothetical protein
VPALAAFTIGIVPVPAEKLYLQIPISDQSDRLKLVGILLSILLALQLNKASPHRVLLIF